MESNIINTEALASMSSVAQWAIYAVGTVVLVTSTLFVAHVLVTAKEEGKGATI